jgi:hypothetical protein
MPATENGLNLSENRPEHAWNNVSNVKPSTIPRELERFGGGYFH